jgi:hypothetical protein
MAYRAQAQGKHLRFGVSGLLYNSDMVLYDRQTESLWSQIMAQAISGPLKGARLELLPLEHTTWLDWKARHPDTLVLSTDTGHARDYTRSPYAGYDHSADLMFPVKFRAQGYHPKERVIGLEIEGQYKAYPFVELARMSREFNDTLAGRPLIIRFDAQHQSGKILDKTGKELPSITVFWFAWYAFHPHTEIFRAPEAVRNPPQGQSKGQVEVQPLKFKDRWGALIDKAADRVDWIERQKGPTKR